MYTYHMNSFIIELMQGVRERDYETHDGTHIFDLIIFYTNANQLEFITFKQT